MARGRHAGILAAAAPDRIRELAETLLADPRIGYISITDSPGGVPMLPADWLGGLVSSQRRRVVLHLTCKDMNRNGLESACWRYAATGFDNVLALTGDYPSGGFGGTARPVFDLDSLGLIQLMRSMNEGLTIPGRRGARRRCRRPILHRLRVSPFKLRESELVPQYFKLLRKLRAAPWVIPSWDTTCGFNEVKLLLAARGMEAR